MSDIKIDFTKPIDYKNLNLDQIVQQGNAGDSAACFVYANLLETGRGRLLIDEDAALDWAIQGMEHGGSEGADLCCGYVGMKWNYFSRGTNKNAHDLLGVCAEKMEYLAKRGNLNAMTITAALYSGTGGIFHQNTNKLISYLAAAAEAGLPEGKTQLAMCYRTTHFGMQDHQRAFDLLQQAAKDEMAAAETYIALYYNEAGRKWPVKKNRVLQRQWLEKSAAQNFPPALYELGEWYCWNKIGRKPDMASAIEYWQAAAERGHIRSADRLAESYACGEIVGPNDPDAGTGNRSLAKAYEICSGLLTRSGLDGRNRKAMRYEYPRLLEHHERLTARAQEIEIDIDGEKVPHLRWEGQDGVARRVHQREFSSPPVA